MSSNDPARGLASNVLQQRRVLVPRRRVGDQLLDEIRSIGDASLVHTDLVEEFPVLDTIRDV